MGRALADLLDDLLAKPQRETVGSNTSLRFNYQKDWAFCQMLRRHMDGADYLVAFEFHDDVVFLESPGSPGKAEFFQVKTSTSATARTLATLTSRRGKGNSILGKLFKNFSGICSGHELKVVLVSNIAFEFAGADLCATDIEPKFRKKIIEKLKAELPDFVEQQVESLHFMITGVSLDAMRSYLRGEAMELFKTKFGEERPAAVAACTVLRISPHDVEVQSTNDMPAGSGFSTSARARSGKHKCNLQIYIFEGSSRTATYPWYANHQNGANWTYTVANEDHSSHGKTACPPAVTLR